MGLLEKIEEIRRKPEHIRLRYVWLMVAISMVFVVALWIFSLKSEKKEENLSGNSAGEIFNQFSEQKKSLQDATQELKNSFPEGAANDPIQSPDFQTQNKQ